MLLPVTPRFGATQAKLAHLCGVMLRRGRQKELPRLARCERTARLFAASRGIAHVLSELFGAGGTRVVLTPDVVDRFSQPLQRLRSVEPCAVLAEQSLLVPEPRHLILRPETDVVTRKVIDGSALFLLARDRAPVRRIVNARGGGQLLRF